MASLQDALKVGLEGTELGEQCKRTERSENKRKKIEKKARKLAKRRFSNLVRGIEVLEQTCPGLGIAVAREIVLSKHEEYHK